MEGFSRPGSLGGEAYEDDSVEGHIMSDDRKDQGSDFRLSDDTEGHGWIKATEDEDVTGHGGLRRATDDDDTEGHGSGLRATDDDDTEGHGFGNLKASPDDDDTEGHGLIR